eukprot:TRINITY_DN46677_c0_g1_i1.p1 TRINITY_DN46677_c0_g1~~TRINITY_DN46677_c0_g1_i1.p1  ORF type:complete len:170 (-),score=55.97 TRINITY_DN46677_c0_g1_i1:211-720(-)
MASVLGCLTVSLLLIGVESVAGTEQRGELTNEALGAEDLKFFTDGFMASDIDKDGQLSRDEALAFAKVENPDIADDPSFVDEVKSDFDNFDSDKSGTLSMPEFIELVNSAEEDEAEQEEEDIDLRDSDGEGNEGDDFDDVADEDADEDEDEDVDSEEEADETNDVDDAP